MGTLADANSKGSFFFSYDTIYLKDISQVTVTPLVEGAGKTYSRMNRYYIAAP
jgi:hypothetical protein